MEKASREKIREIELLAASRKEAILNAESDYPKDAERYYYVDSISGDDEADGMSEKTAWRNLERINNADIEKGSVVLFRRGGLWRGTLSLAEGVYYSAYGEGEKPKFYASVAANNPDDWSPTKWENVWVYNPMISYVKDVGAVIFNDGECWGVKVCKNFVTGERCDPGRDNCNPEVFNGRTKFTRQRGPIDGPSVLKNDLEFYHDYSNERLYLYCPDGNPAKAFHSIELSLRRNAVIHGKNVTVDNFCVKYAGIHAIGHNGQNVCFKNCEIGWIGGSNQFPEHQLLGLNTPFGTDTTRLGNGCEVYGGCNNYEIKNCYFYQIYDAAVTAQFMNGYTEKEVIMNNISWHDNVIDTSVYAFELWLAVQKAAEGVKVEMKNVDISHNICTNCGYGWSSQRPDPGYTFFYGDCQYTVCEFENAVIHDNIFANGKGKITTSRMFGGKNGIQFENNEIYSNGEYLGVHAENMEDYTTSDGSIRLFPIEATDENLNKLIDGGYWKNCKYYNFDKDETVSEPYIKF